jgi:hypothetical protein
VLAGEVLPVLAENVGKACIDQVLAGQFADGGNAAVADEISLNAERSISVGQFGSILPSALRTSRRNNQSPRSAHLPSRRYGRST